MVHCLSQFRFNRPPSGGDHSTVTGLSACPQLTHLDLGRCRYGEADLRRCSRLEVLWLGDGCEMAADEDYQRQPGDLAALRDLALRDARAGLPAWLCVPGLTRLDLHQELPNSEPYQVALPPEVSLLTALRVMDLSNQRLAGVPSSVTALSGLTELVFSISGSTPNTFDLPPGPYLEQLQRLVLSNCGLVDVSPVLARATALTFLDVSCNSELWLQRSDIPAISDNMPGLRGLALGKSPEHAKYVWDQESVGAMLRLVGRGIEVLLEGYE
eukprot:scaffold24.g2949.t1